MNRLNIGCITMMNSND